MATINGTVQNKGLTAMVEGVSTTASLSLYAYDDDAQTEYAGSVTYSTASNGVAEISSNVTITIPTGGHIDSVRLGTSTLNIFATVTTDIDFPNGGDLIITSYKLTVVAG